MDDDFVLGVYSVICTLIVSYISIWLMFLQPIIYLMNFDIVSGKLLAITLLKIMLALPVGRILSKIFVIIGIKFFY